MKKKRRGLEKRLRRRMIGRIAGETVGVCERVQGSKFKVKVGHGSRLIKVRDSRCGGLPYIAYSKSSLSRPDCLNMEA
jgi:hypothetical protein